MKSIITRLAATALLAAAISPVAAQDALQSYIVVLRPGTANVPEVAAQSFTKGVISFATKRRTVSRSARCSGE